MFQLILFNNSLNFIVFNYCHRLKKNFNHINFEITIFKNLKLLNYFIIQFFICIFSSLL